MTDTATAESETATEAPPGGEIAPEAEALKRFLDGERHDIREHVRKQMADPDFAPVAGMERDEYRDLVWKWTKKMAEDGHPKMLFPKEYGGGGDIGGAVTAFETLGHADLSLLVKCGVQFGLFGGAILHLGNEGHHREYLPDVMTCELPGCFAMTESGHGSDVQRLRTRAVYDRDSEEFVIDTPDESARKDYIGNAARHGRMAVVFAQLDVDGEEHGVHALLVPIRDEEGNELPGVTIEDCGDKIGLNGVDNGRIAFEDVRVPRTALLDRYGKVNEDGRYESPIESKNGRFFTMIGTLIQGRVSVSGAGLSATKSALTIAIRHAQRRVQFGPPDSDREVPLMHYLVHQRRLLPPLAKVYTIHFAQRKLVEQLHQAFSGDEPEDRDRRKLEAFAAGVKATSTWHATETIQTCREACGGAGYMAENRFSSLKADTDVFTTFEGDNTVLIQLVAKGILTDYKTRIGDLSRLDLIRFYGEQAYETAVERTLARQLMTRIVDAVTPDGGDPDEERDVDDRDYELELFRWREEHLISGVARRLKGGIDDGHDQFEVFNHCQDHVLRAAQAHVDRQILEAFADAIDECDDDSIKPLLQKLFQLYALHNIEQDRGWFFEHGRMTGPRAKAITRSVNRLCRELSECADVLVDAFGIPDGALAAPIGLKNPDGA
jgi:acyl-CoA oxidase